MYRSAAPAALLISRAIGTRLSFVVDETSHSNLAAGGLMQSAARRRAIFALFYRFREGRIRHKGVLLGDKKY
jgi:chromosome segregation ATPase